MVILVTITFRSSPPQSLEFVQSEIVAEGQEKDEIMSSRHSTSSECAVHKGFIISNQLGLLGNNIFEIGFANRLATELCWDVFYRPMWNNNFPVPRAQYCFPNAMLPAEEIPQELRNELGMNSDHIYAMTEIFEEQRRSNPASNFILKEWTTNLTEKGQAMQLQHVEYDFTGNKVDILVERLRLESSKVRVLYLAAFFIHYDWLSGWRDEMREWFAMNTACCQTPPPPEEAVVIHIRDFNPEDDGKNKGLNWGVYVHILKEYGLLERPVWIVCQPKSVNTTLIQGMLVHIPNSEVHTGEDDYDAYCVMQRAKVLIPTTSSSFSQIAGLLGSPDTVIHYPTHTLDYPMVTLSVPDWKYHLVDGSLNEIKEFDIDHERLKVGMA
jgi:hypothetical protein